MTTSESTRNDAYYSLENLSASRRAVYDVIERLGPITDAQIAKALGWGINRVTGRRNELVSIGRVVEAGTEFVRVRPAGSDVEAG